MAPHLLRCQRLAVAAYSFTFGRLEAGAPSAFAQLGLNSQNRRFEFGVEENRFCNENI